MSRGNDIIKEAQAKKERLDEEILELTAKYAEYKANFNSLIRKLRRTLDDNDFDPNAANTVAASGYHKNEENTDTSFFDISGASGSSDSSSSSGGFGSGSSSSGGTKLSMANKQSNSSNVYGSTLGGDGIDPFSDITFMDD